MAAGSGGVDACFDNGEGDIGVPLGEGDFGARSLVGDSGVGGASEPRRDLALTLSKSGMRNGSGSKGSIIFSSLRVGVVGVSIRSVVSLNVTLGTLFFLGVMGKMMSAIAS